MCVCVYTYTYICIRMCGCVHVCVRTYMHIHTCSLPRSPSGPPAPMVSPAVILDLLVPPIGISARCLIHRDTCTRGSQATYLVCQWVQPDVCWGSHNSCHSGCWHHGHMGHSDLWSCFSCCTHKPIRTHACSRVKTTPTERVRNSI